MNIGLLIYLVLPAVVAGLFFVFSKRVNPLVLDLLAVVVTLLLAALTVYLYAINPFKEAIISTWGLTLVLDGLSQMLLLLANIIACVVVIYATTYASHYQAKGLFYGLFLSMLTGINGVILTGDLITLFIFLEMAALSAYALVAFNKQREELEASFKYFIMGEIASLFILVAIGLLYSVTKSVDMREIANFILPKGIIIKNLAAALFLVGFGMKAALFPFHSWLPDAHTAAPSPVSAMLSGIIIKTLGVYALMRIIYNVIGISPEISGVLLLLGILSVLIGGFLSLGQSDLKRIMAYSTISQIGYIFIGFGLATPFGFLAALFHLFNHAFIKSLLFLNAGAIEQLSGSRDLRLMGGLAKKLPVVYATNLVGSLAISGLPPFNGFWSKLFIIIACLQAGQLGSALVAVFGSLLTLAAYLKIQTSAFASCEIAGQAEPKRLSFTMGAAMVGLSLSCLLIGLSFPIIVNYIINPAVGSLARGVGYGSLILGVLK